jgi:hypothetical protein
MKIETGQILTPNDMAIVKLFPISTNFGLDIANPAERKEIIINLLTLTRYLNKGNPLIGNYTL